MENEMKEKIRQSVRSEIKRQVNETQDDGKKEEKIDESLGGVLSVIGGLVGASVSFQAGALMSLATVNPLPFLAGLGGAFASIATTVAIARKFNDRAVKNAYMDLLKVVQERDAFFEGAKKAEEMGESGVEYLSKYKSQIKRATKAQQSAAKKLRKVLASEPMAVERLSGPEQKKLDDLLNMAEQGLVTAEK